ncbi:MAG: flagellar hook basal-body protein [Planctomycetales bacterium]|nr:flagellar hook basal-body protein [Planctomycetales bacterium]
MLRGLYSAATAMDAATTNQEIISHNLAYANVPGFRRSVMSFETFETRLQRQLASEPGAYLGTRVSQVKTDFQMGRLEQTGRPLDVALASPEGFFVLGGPDGPRYTRSGVFHIGEDGNLVTSTGVPVQGAGGPIAIPADASPSQIRIGTDGTVWVNENQVGQLDIVRFADPDRLQPTGTLSFSAPPDMPPEPAEVTVAQGMRESSNVSAVDELVRMIAGMRYFEASQRALRQLGETVHEHTNPQAG